MVRLRYLACDYELNYAVDSRFSSDRYTLKLNGRRPRIGEKSSGYRSPWTRVTKEADLDNTVDADYGSTFQNHFRLAQRHERLCDNAMQSQSLNVVSVPADLKSFCQSLELEQVLFNNQLKDRRKNAKKLMRKHKAMVLSDPYAEIQDKFPMFEKLDFPTMVKSSYDATMSDILDDMHDSVLSKFEITEPEKFIEDRNLPALSKVYDVEMPVKEEIANEASIENYVNTLIRIQPRMSLLEKRAEILNVTDSNFEFMVPWDGNEQRIVAFESPQNMASIGCAMDMEYELKNKIVELPMQEDDAESWRRYTKIHGCNVREDCNPVEVSRIILSDVSLRKAERRQIARNEIVPTKKLCEGRDLFLIEDNETPSNCLNGWIFHIFNGNAPVFEKLSYNHQNQAGGVSKAEYQSSVTSYSTEGEIFFKFEGVMEDDYDEEAGISEKSSMGSSQCSSVGYDYTEKNYTTTEDEEKSTACMSQAVAATKPFRPHRKVEEDKTNSFYEYGLQQPHAKSGNRKSPLDAFLYQRGLARKPQVNSVQCEDTPKTEAAEENAQQATEHSIAENKFPTVGQLATEPIASCYRIAKIYKMGPLTRVLKELEVIVEPALTILRKFKIIADHETFAVLEEDLLKYHLRKMKKDLQETGANVAERSCYAAQMVVFCFLVCKSKLLKLSELSAIGFLTSFRDSKGQMLNSVISGTDEYNFLSSAIPRAVDLLQQAVDDDSFVHPKIQETIKILHEKFTKDSRRGIAMSKALVIVQQYCNHLFEELLNALQELNSQVLNNTMKVTVLHSSIPVSKDIAIADAIDRGFNVIIVSNEFANVKMLWSRFSLFLEYEAFAESPWKEISSAHQICHMALEMKWPHLPEDPPINEQAPPNITLVASGRITKCRNLVQVLETRHNISVMQYNIDDNDTYKNARSLFGDGSPTCAPDVIISTNTCMVIEDCALLCNRSIDNDLHKLTVRIIELENRFSKCYVVVCHLSDGKFRYPISGIFFQNLEKLNNIVSRFMSKSFADYQIRVLNANDVEEFAAILQRLSAREDPNKVLRAPALADFSPEEKFLAQFPSINILMAHKLLVNVLKEKIGAISLKELEESVPDIPARFLKDFHERIHAQDPV